MVAGYMATSKTKKFWPRDQEPNEELNKQGTKVILAQITALTTTTLTMIFGGSIQKCLNKGDYQTTLCSMFGITLLILVTVIVAATYLEIADLKLEVSLFFSIALLLFFFMADT